MLIGYTTDAWMQLSKCQQDRDTFSYLESFDKPMHMGRQGSVILQAQLPYFTVLELRSNVSSYGLHIQIMSINETVIMKQTPFAPTEC